MLGKEGTARIQTAECTNPVQIRESNEFLRTANQTTPESWRENGRRHGKNDVRLISRRGRLVRGCGRG